MNIYKRRQAVQAFLQKKDTSRAATDANLWEVANDMSTLPIDLCQNVEEKRLNVEVQSLMIEEQFCKQAQVLAV